MVLFFCKPNFYWENLKNFISKLKICFAIFINNPINLNKSFRVGRIGRVTHMLTHMITHMTSNICLDELHISCKVILKKKLFFLPYFELALKS